MWKLCKKYGLAILLVLVGVLGYGWLNQSEPVKGAVLTIGLQSGYPPFEFVNEGSEVVGFDIDLGELIAKKMGKGLVIKDMDFDGEILSLRQGKIDLILSGMDITESRLKEIWMVPYHGNAENSLSLMFWGKVPEGIHGLEDLTDGIVSVEAGASPEVYLQKYPAIQVRSFEGALAPFMDVKMGKSVANLVESDVAAYLQKQHPEIKILNVPLAEGEKTLGFGIGIKKGNEALFEQVSKIVQELKESGELKELEDKWFKGES